MQDRLTEREGERERRERENLSPYLVSLRRFQIFENQLESYWQLHTRLKDALFLPVQLITKWECNANQYFCPSLSFFYIARNICMRLLSDKNCGLSFWIRFSLTWQGLGRNIIFTSIWRKWQNSIHRMLLIFSVKDTLGPVFFTFFKECQNSTCKYIENTVP